MFSSVTNWSPFQLRPEKKRYSRLSVVTLFQLQPEKKDTVVWPSFVAPFQLPLLHRSNYDWKKKRYSRLSVVMLFQIRPEKKTKIWRVRNRYYDWKKKSSSHLSGGCMIVITTGKKNLVVCWAQPVPITTGKKRYSRLSVVTPFQIRPEKKNLAVARSLLRPQKKSSSHLSGGCMMSIQWMHSLCQFKWF